jgi:predicted molibdopterin-dependent oxidoreductase YjgC
MDLDKPITEVLSNALDAPALTLPVPPGPVPVPPESAISNQVEITVDQQKISVPEGSTLLEATRALGIDTPTLCYLENLTPVNVCRVCVVELEGSRALVPACSRKVEAGMVVKTDSERVRLSRRLVLELLASSVDVSTAPQLQTFMQRYSARPERFGMGNRVAKEHAAGRNERLDSHCAATLVQPVKIDNELYVRDYAKCILCYKCVEACGKDAQNTFAIAVAGRGFQARISTEYDVPLPDSACVYCGNCIGVCPTGALMFRSEYEMRQTGTWDESKQRQTDTICPYCGVGCTLTLHVQENEIVRVTSPLDQEVTHGHLCIKGRFGWQYVRTPQETSHADDAAPSEGEGPA